MKGSKIKKKTALYYIHLSNAYARLEEFSDDPDPQPKVSKSKNNDETKTVAPPKQSSTFKAQAAARKRTRKQQYIKNMNDNGVIDMYISKAEDDKTRFRTSKIGRASYCIRFRT